MLPQEPWHSVPVGQAEETSLKNISDWLGGRFS